MPSGIILIAGTSEVISVAKGPVKISFTSITNPFGASINVEENVNSEWVALFSGETINTGTAQIVTTSDASLWELHSGDLIRFRTVGDPTTPVRWKVTSN